MKLLTFGLFLVALSAWAEPDLSRAEFQNLTQSGKLVTLTVQPQPKAFLFSIVGKPTLKIDLANTHVDVVVLKQDAKSPMTLTKLTAGKYLSETLNTAEALKMEVRVKVGDETEKFDVSIPQR